MVMRREYGGVILAPSGLSAVAETGCGITIPVTTKTILFVGSEYKALRKVSYKSVWVLVAEGTSQWYLTRRKLLHSIEELVQRCNIRLRDPGPQTRRLETLKPQYPKTSSVAVKERKICYQI